MGQGLTQSDAVHEFQAGAGGNPRGQPGDFESEGGKFPGQVDGGGFAAGIGAKTENDLLGSVFFC